MVLIYENNEGRLGTPKSVEGFMPCKGDDLSFAKAKGWRISTKSSDFTTGYHESVYPCNMRYNAYILSAHF